MLNKPEKCCKMGTYECQVPMAINGRVQGIDFCIAHMVAMFNANNLTTVASCCGHGITEGIISLEDGRDVIITSKVFRDAICNDCMNGVSPKPVDDFCIFRLDRPYRCKVQGNMTVAQRTGKCEKYSPVPF